jgi:hypothetical protein
LIRIWTTGRIPQATSASRVLAPAVQVVLEARMLDRMQAIWEINLIQGMILIWITGVIRRVASVVRGLGIDRWRCVMMIGGENE